VDTPLSLYLHIPFCLKRCGYCDFTTYAGMESIIPTYVTALCGEIAYHHEVHGLQLPVKTVYFGGGTPSLLPAAQLRRIFECLHAHYLFSSEPEISLEANPGTLSLEFLQSIRSLGVNRLSIGVQSVHSAELRFLDRQHDMGDVLQAIAWARKAGFANLSLDLIFGLPQQDIRSWRQSLMRAADLRPDHLSLYGLTIEEGTPLAGWVGRGLCSLPDPDVAAEMYEWAMEYLDQKGWKQYEISNWARVSPDQPLPVCRHNLQYWNNQPYLGLGAGAHGYASRVRTANVLTPAAYIHSMDATQHQILEFPATPAAHSVQQVDTVSEIGDTMMMGLRLVEQGVSATRFYERFGLHLQEHFADQIERLEQAGLIEWGKHGGERVLRLTKTGRLLGNQVFIEFI
jgi:oxygen-independent coproporphyrinogen III oxidase